MDIKYKDMKERLGEVKSIDKDTRTITGYASTGTVDRHGEIVDPKAFKKDLKRFLKERHLFAANHRYVNDAGEPTIIGKVVDASIDDNGLLATFQFDTDELSEKWWQKYVSKTLNAFSIGFIPIKWVENEVQENNDSPSRRILTYTEVELLEISAVPIPANREAIVTNSLELGRIDDLCKQVSELRETNKALHDYVRDFANQALRHLGVLAARVSVTAPSGLANDCRISSLKGVMQSAEKLGKRLP